MALGQEIASFYATIGADTKGFKKGLDDTKDGMSSLEKASSGIGKVATAAFAVGAAGAVAFGAAIGKSVSAAADFEQGITDISAVMGLSAKETEKLQEHITNLGLDPKLKVSATEATSAIMSLGTAGLSLDEILGGASEATIRLANATGGDMGDAAALVTDAMGQFGLTAQDTGHIVDQLTGLTVASKFSFQDAALAFGQVGGTAGAMGLSLEDTNAILATTASSFSSGSAAGTSLKTMLTTLIPKSSEAEDVMASLGLVTVDYARMSKYLSGVLGQEVEPSFNGVYDAFKKTTAGAQAAEKSDEALAKAFNGLKAQYSENQFFDDTTGKMKSGAEIAGVLQTAFSGLSDEQKNNAASTIFGVDAMNTAFALMKAGTPGVNEMADAIGKVNAGDIAAKRMDTFAGAMEIAMGVIETLTISIGQQFLPILRPLVEGFSNLAQTAGPQLVEFFGGIAQYIGNAITSFMSLASVVTDGADAIANFLPLLGVSDEVAQNLAEAYFVLSNNIGGIIKVIKAAFKPIGDIITKFVSWQDVLAAVGVIMLGPVVGAIGAVVAAIWPVIAVVGQVTAVIVALKAAWQTNFLGIKTITQDTLMFIGDWLREKTNLWKGDWTKTLDYLLNHSDQVWAELSGNVITAFNDWTREAKHVVLTWTTWVIKEIVDWAARTKSHFELWVGWIVGDFGVLTKLKTKAIEIFRAILGWWDDHIQPWINAGKDVVQGLWDGMKQVWSDFMQWWNHVWGKDLTKTVQVKMETHSPSKVMERLGANVVEGFAIGADSMMPAVYDAMGGLSNASISASYMGGTGQPDNSNARIEELLAQLINAVNNKNMTVNVAAAGGGMDYGAQTNFMAQGRR